MDRLLLYEVFVRIVERGNLSAAGRDLSMPQPTVSRHLKMLESQLGTRLLERTTHVVTLTEQGELMYERAKRLLEEYELTASAMQASQQELRGTIKVSTSIAFGQQFLAELLAEFQLTYPGIDVGLDLNDRFVNVVEEGIDLSIRFGKLPSLDLVAHKLGLARRVLVASPGYIKKFGAPKTAAELATHNVVLYGLLNDISALEILENGKLRTVNTQGGFQCNNGLAIVKLYELGIGIGEAMEALVSKSLDDGLLVRILPNCTRPPLEVHALHPPSRYVKPKVRALIEFLRRRIPNLPGFESVN
jgi:DNA-binding transcriptional LysR family regulator